MNAIDSNGVSLGRDLLNVNPPIRKEAKSPPSTEPMPSQAAGIVNGPVEPLKRPMTEYRVTNIYELQDVLLYTLPGDIVYCDPGFYEGHVHVPAGVTVAGDPTLGDPPEFSNLEPEGLPFWLENDATLRYLYINGSGVEAIKADNTTGVMITQCLINRSGLDAINLRNSIDASVYSNTILNSGFSGIVASGSSSLTIDYNTISYSGYHGIYDIGDQAQVTRNTIEHFTMADIPEGVDHCGIRVGNSFNSRLAENYIVGEWDNNVGIQVEYAPADIVLRRNTVTNCEVGIKLYSDVFADLGKYSIGEPGCNNIYGNLANISASGYCYGRVIAEGNRFMTDLDRGRVEPGIDITPWLADDGSNYWGGDLPVRTVAFGVDDPISHYPLYRFNVRVELNEYAEKVLTVGDGGPWVSSSHVLELKTGLLQHLIPAAPGTMNYSPEDLTDYLTQVTNAKSDVETAMSYCATGPDLDFLTAVDVYLGGIIASDVEENESRAPGQNLKIESSSPNPFKAQTKVSFNLPANGRAAVKIIGLDGRLVCNLADKEMAAGRHIFEWDAKDQPNGVYFFTISFQGQVISKRLVLER